MNSQLKDYYSILGVSKNATGEEIKKAFKKMARTYHPDVNPAPDAHEQFIEIAEAYEVLKDPASRSHYDSIFANANSSYHQHHSEQASYDDMNLRAKAQAEKYAGMSLDDLLSKVIDFAIEAVDYTFETGRAILVGEREKPKITILDYIKMGFLGILLTICIIISFTGIGTIPGVAIALLVIHGISKDGRFIGVIPFILTAIAADIIVIILLFMFLSSL